MTGPAPEQTLSMSYVTALCRDMAVPDQQMLDVLCDIGVQVEASEPLPDRIDIAAFTTLYRRLVTIREDEMPGLFSRPFRPGALRLTCMTLLDGETLCKALKRWAHLLRQLQDDFTLDVQIVGARCVWSIQGGSGSQPLPCATATDLMLKLVHGMSSWLIGKTIAVRRVGVRAERSGHAGDYRAQYGCPVRFAQDASALEIDACWMDQPVVRGKQDLEAFLAAAPGNCLVCRFDDERLSERLRKYLAGVLPGTVTADGAAQALHLSARSLHRRLQQESTTFQRVKDELRRDIALHKLTRSAEPIAAIAFELGFDSIPSFHRAFKGWTGDTPGAYRMSR